MDLILWRHADAGDAQSGAGDEHRGLTPKGERQASRMAKWLNRQLPESTRVLVSPTARTQQTAAFLDFKVRLCPDIAPGKTMTSLLTAARWPDGKESVLIVGHQDTLGLTVAWLMASQTQPWTIRKGAVWWIRLRTRDDSPKVILHAVLSPDHV